MDSNPIYTNDNEESPDGDGSNPSGKGKGVKVERSRRTWTAREEAVLLTAMKDLSCNRWKGDNGFRAGYLTRVEEAIRRELPTTDIRVHPHIYSKVTTWKKQYYSLVGILNRSGVGFNNDGEFKIDCDDEQWAQIVQKDSNARYMRNKSWPLWNDWQELFGKDRAEGVRGMDVPTSAKKIYGNSVSSAGSSGTSPSPNMTFEELFPDEVPPEGILPEMVDESVPVAEMATDVPVPNAAKRVVKRRKVEDKLDGVIDLMNRIHEDTNDRLKEISSRIGYDFDLSAKRTEVFNQLKGIPGLTLKQQFYISKKLVKESEYMDLFRGLPEESRPSFVLDLLEIDGMV